MGKPFGDAPRSHLSRQAPPKSSKYRQVNSPITRWTPVARGFYTGLRQLTKGCPCHVLNHFTPGCRVVRNPLSVTVRSRSGRRVSLRPGRPGRSGPTDRTRALSVSLRSRDDRSRIQGSQGLRLSCGAGVVLGVIGPMHPWAASAASEPVSAVMIAGSVSGSSPTARPRAGTAGPPEPHRRRG